MTIMTISNLQREMIEEILSRVPLSSMRAVRLTCKNWNSLSKNRSFTKMHIGRLGEAAREGEYQMVVMKMVIYDSLCLMSIIVDDDESYTEIEIKGSLTCLEERVKISQVFHCEGLLLCILEDDCTRSVVWNPYSGQTRWIEPRSSYRLRNGDKEFNYAFGYEDKKSGHKLLRFTHNRAFEIYDFEYDLWKSIVVDPEWRILPCSLGVSLKGNTYWCATKGRGYSLIEDLDHIICFDFTSERFGPLLPLPSRKKPGSDRFVTLSCVREEKLAALFHQGQRYGQSQQEIESWITTSKIEFGKDISWSKLVTVAAGPDADIPKPVLGSFFIDEVKKVAMVFGPATFIMIGYFGSVRVSNLGKPSYADAWPWPLICPYVPSVVQIKKAT